jgi:hypothetical protein
LGQTVSREDTMNPIDSGLRRLSSDGPEHELDDLENAVLARIAREAHADVFRGRALPIQFAAGCVALLIGLFIAGLVQSDIAQPRSEAAVLSEDSGLAPSIALEGGA